MISDYNAKALGRKFHCLHLYTTLKQQSQLISQYPDPTIFCNRNQLWMLALKMLTCWPANWQTTEIHYLSQICKPTISNPLYRHTWAHVHLWDVRGKCNTLVKAQTHRVCTNSTQNAPQLRTECCETTLTTVLSETDRPCLFLVLSKSHLTLTKQIQLLFPKRNCD